MYTVYVCQTRCGCCSLLIIPILKDQQSCTGVLVARAGFGVPFQRCNRQIIIINAGYFVPVGKLGIAISISVCLAVCPRAYLRNHTSDFHKFLWMLPTAVAQPSSGGIMICYVLPVLWMTSCLQAMARNWRRKRRILTVTQHGQHRFDIAVYTQTDPSSGSEDGRRNDISTLPCFIGDGTNNDTYYVRSSSSQNYQNGFY